MHIHHIFFVLTLWLSECAIGPWSLTSNIQAELEPHIFINIVHWGITRVDRVFVDKNLATHINRGALWSRAWRCGLDIEQMLLLKLTLTSGIPAMGCCTPSMEHQSLDLSLYLLSTVCFPLESQRERETGREGRKKMKQKSTCTTLYKWYLYRWEDSTWAPPGPELL